jgi:small subunit ribosomal protein S20
MAHSLSAKKRIRQNVKHRARNRWRKVRFREAIKAYRETLLHGTVEKATEQLQSLYKLLDQVASKGTIHKNTASRYKSRLALRLNKKKSAGAGGSAGAAPAPQPS